MSVYIGINRVSRSERVDYPEEGTVKRGNAGLGVWGQRNMVTGK
jgi:hypothetical protein